MLERKNKQNNKNAWMRRKDNRKLSERKQENKWREEDKWNKCIEPKGGQKAGPRKVRGGAWGIVVASYSLSCVRLRTMPWTRSISS